MVTLSTQCHQEHRLELSFRLKGKGIQRINSSTRGDQYVKVNVQIPKKISDKQADLLKKFAEEDGEIVNGSKKKLGQKIEDFFTK